MYKKQVVPLNLAKNFGVYAETIEQSFNYKLKKLNEHRIRNSGRDEELYLFGIELFENNYTLEDFKMDIEICNEGRNNFNDETYPEHGAFVYEGCEHAPSYKKILKVADKPQYFSSVECGYNVAKRRAIANNLVKDSNKVYMK